MAQEGSRRAGQRERKQRVAEASWELFHRNGFDGTSVRDIAAAAGVSVGTVINAGGKARLFLATMEENAFARVGGGLAHLGARPVTARRSLAGEISGVFDNALRWVAENLDLTRDYLVAYLRAGPDAHTRPDDVEIIVSGIAARCVQHSGRPSDEPAALLSARVIYGVFVSIVFGLAAGAAGSQTAARKALRELITAQLRHFERDRSRS